MIILPIVWVENTVEKVDFNFPKKADWSYLVKIVLIMHNKSSQGDIALNSVKALATIRFLEHSVAATVLQLLPWCLSCSYWTHIMHHGEDSTISYVVWLHERQYEHQINSWVQLQQQTCSENLLVVQSL